MSTSPETSLPVRRLPGDLAMWWFILAEITLFSILILAFAITQRLQPALFAAGREALDASMGLALTLSLLTSGLLVALAVTRVRQARSGAGLLLLAALLSACVYVWLKLSEYAHLLELGLDVEHDTFFTLYWLLTGLHFLHVLLGLVIIAWMAVRAWRGRYHAGNCSGLESGALYWHMVDLVWVLLFPLVYLIGAGP